MSFEEPREYLSDDRDISPYKLVVSMGGNGDWYISVLPIGHRIGPTVRITTHGTPRGLENMPLAVSNLYKALKPTE